MGKKDKEKKKKGKGAEKTAEKTEKKLKLKSKKEMAAKGEDDIESMIKAIEEEEKKRQEVKEVACGPPSHRSNFSITAHPDLPEIIFFGGEFYNGQKTTLFKDLFVFNIKRGEWSQVKSPGGPPPRSSHQAAIVSAGGGQLWIFGGEFSSPSETQFYHYKDLWCFHFSSARWEKVTATGGPSARSGHRMAVFKNRYLVVFGGFHDNLRECKYFNDLHAFDLETRSWAKLSTVGPEPSPRSACQFFPTGDGRLVVFGGYCKMKVKKEREKGVVHQDMFLLSQEKHDETGTKWRWQAVKQVGQRPTPRSGLCSAVGKDDRVYMFGGVNDEEKEDEDDDDSDDEGQGNFFNELYSVVVEGERATWHLVSLTGKKDKEVGEKKKRRKVKEDGEDEEENEDHLEKMEDLAIEEAASSNTVTVESGAFTISSTVGGESSTSESKGSAEEKLKDVFIPSARFGSGLAFKGGTLYLFGGTFEDGEKDITLKDFYSLDTKHFDTWNTLVESDVQTMEWFGEEDESDDDDDESGEDSDMETDQ